MARRAGKRRPVIIRDIKPPAMLATDLYQAGYADMLSAWEQAVDPIMAAYRLTLAQIATDATHDSPADIEGEIAAAERGMASLFLLLTPRLRDLALRVERWHRARWVAAVLAASSVNIGTMIGPESMRVTLDTAIARNVGLIRSISDEARTRISAAVFDGLRNRTPADEVAKQVRAATGMARARARRVASDQLAKLTSALADERRREVGIVDWMWRHSGKLHPREEHKARDGNIYSDSPTRVGQSVMGKRIAAPPQDRPGQLPFCGCRSQSVLDI